MLSEDYMSGAEGLGTRSPAVQILEVSPLLSRGA